MTENELYHFGVKGMKWGGLEEIDRSLKEVKRKQVPINQKLRLGGKRSRRPL